MTKRENDGDAQITHFQLSSRRPRWWGRYRLCRRRPCGKSRHWKGDKAEEINWKRINFSSPSPRDLFLSKKQFAKQNAVSFLRPIEIYSLPEPSFFFYIFLTPNPIPEREREYRASPKEIKWKKMYSTADNPKCEIVTESMYNFRKKKLDNVACLKILRLRKTPCLLNWLITQDTIYLRKWTQLCSVNLNIPTLICHFSWFCKWVYILKFPPVLQGKQIPKLRIYRKIRFCLSVVVVVMMMTFSCILVFQMENVRVDGIHTYEFKSAIFYRRGQTPSDPPPVYTVPSIFMMVICVHWASIGFFIFVLGGTDRFGMIDGKIGCSVTVWSHVHLNCSIDLRDMLY